MLQQIIPPARNGKNTNLTSEVELSTLEGARACFVAAQERLLSPGKWKELTGKLSAEFRLYRSGNPLYEQVRQADLIRIDIPGPGTSGGGGYDWVEVAMIEYTGDPAADEESVAMKLIPTAAPGTDPNVADHFFEKGASSSFVIKRIANKVVVEYHGRNEVPNNKANKASDKLRNAIVALGAIAGFSELQWKALIKAFITV